jgi:uncharacterized protein (DUF4415 family)
MKKNGKRITRFELDRNNPPPLTAKQQMALNTLANMPDAEIDYSDIPAPDGVLYRPAKEMTTVRIDADVLAWLKSGGKGYQTKINAILRREMLAAQPTTKKGVAIAANRAHSTLRETRIGVKATGRHRCHA